jgi:hypothetical protein
MHCLADFVFGINKNPATPIPIPPKPNTMDQFSADTTKVTKYKQVYKLYSSYMYSNGKAFLALQTLAGEDYKHCITQDMVDKVDSLSEQRRIFHRAKIIDYKIPYHISCKNPKMMEIIESAILMKLNKYKSKTHRDIFLTNNIEMFINIFDECLKFYEDIDEAVYPSRYYEDDD